MTTENQLIDEIRYVDSRDEGKKAEQNPGYTLKRPGIRVARKLGIITQIATAFGLKSEELDGAEQFWRETEFAVRRRRDHLQVKISDHSGLEVRPGSIAVVGRKDDAAIEAALTQAKQLWSGRVSVYGSEDFKVKAWAHAQVAGVELAGYTPPPEKHAQAYQEVLRLCHAKMKQHNIQFIGPSLGGVPDPSGFVDDDARHAANAAASARAAAPTLGELLYKAEQTARWLPLADTSKLAAAGFVDDEPMPVRAPARSQPKGP